jgi:hypothetical protein
LKEKRKKERIKSKENGLKRAKKIENKEKTSPGSF